MLIVVEILLSVESKKKCLIKKPLKYYMFYLQTVALLGITQVYHLHFLKGKAKTYVYLPKGILSIYLDIKMKVYVNLSLIHIFL